MGIISWLLYIFTRRKITRTILQKNIKMYFSKVAMVCLVAVVSARPQVDDYSSITDENDPRFMFDPNPQYAYKYQVSDDPQQTYIAHEEQRDGAAVSGQYSYVDPNGALIVVKYTAGDDGYQNQRGSTRICFHQSQASKDR